jgi:uncharacterized protein YndB with AHSA1/START domain
MAADPVTASVLVAADPEVVFEYFTRAEAIVRWIGENAVLDPRPGGEFMVDIGGVAVRGRYLEIDPPHRLVISWGHAGSQHLPPGASTLEIRLERHEGGTTVHIIHSGLPEPEAAGHRDGWRHFLAQLALEVQGGNPELRRPRAPS